MNSWKESQPFLPFLHTLILWIIVLFSFHSNELSAMDTVIQRNRNTNRWVIDPLAFITPEFSAAVRAINPFICHSKIPGPFTRKVNGPGFLRKARSELLSSLPCAPQTPSQSDRWDSPGRRKQLRILRDSCREPGDGAGEGQGGKPRTLYAGNA